MAIGLKNLLLPEPTRRHAEPVCGHCNYCVRGITTLTCPECGSDLREVGIIAPNARHPLPAWTKAILWTICLPIPALIISGLLLTTVLPYSTVRKVNRTIFCQAPYLTTTIQVFGTERLASPAIANQAAPIMDELMLDDQLIPIFMDVNVKTGAYSYRNKNTTIQQPAGFSASIIADWLKTSGVNAADPKVRKMCDGVYAAIVEIPPGAAINKFTPLLDANGKQIGTAHPAFYWIVHDEPHPAVIGSLCALWAGVWLYGIRLIYRRRTITAAP